MPLVKSEDLRFGGPGRLPGPGAGVSAALRIIAAGVLLALSWPALGGDGAVVEGSAAFHPSPRSSSPGLPLSAEKGLKPLPSFESLRAAHQPSDLLIVDRHGEALAALRMDYTERRGAWVPLQAVSPALQRAVLLSEDRRFYEHDGVDWLAAAAAGWGWAWGDGLRGHPR